MGRTVRIAGLWLFLVGVSLPATVGAETAQLGAALAVRPAPLYREPKGSAEVLGTYPVGTRMKVFLPARSGWYVLGFSQPYKGAKYAWIPVWALKIEDSGGAAAPTPASPTRTSESQNTASTAYTRSEFPKNSISAGAEFFMMAPADFQASVSDTARPSIFAIGFGAEYGRRFGRWISLAFKGGFYQFSQTISAGTATGLAYSASGFWGGPFLGIHFVSSPSVSLALKIGGGVSFNTVGNTSTAEEVTTSNLLGFPIQGKLSFTYSFFEGWGFFVDLGYQLHSISAAPILSPPAYSSTTLGSTNVTLSAPLGCVGLSYQF